MPRLEHSLAITLAAGEYATLRTLAKQAENVERVVIAIENQVRAFAADGWPEAAFVWTSEQVPALRLIRGRLLDQLAEVMEGTSIHAWVQETRGLGRAVFFVLGLMPPLEEFRTVSGVWKYVGLHVSDGAAVRQRKGQRLGFSARRRAYALMRVGEPCIKARSPYREIYDRRKQRTAVTHPDMLKEGAGCEYCDLAYQRTKAQRAERKLERVRTSVAIDCANLGGVHWSPKHRHMDALRVMTKSILRDAFRISRGQAPLLAAEGDHTTPDNHR
jgi:hypothetical protein